MEIFQKIKRITIEALVSSDELLDQLVLKGGNALDLVYDFTSRSSFDIDFSIENEFEELSTISTLIKKSLEKTFTKYEYQIIDFDFKEKPDGGTSEDLKDFWGGYTLKFKVIETIAYQKYKHNPQLLRGHTISINDTQHKTIKVDVSKYEYCSTKLKRELDGQIIFVYSPPMIVIEKLRAICQQMDNYLLLVRSTSKSQRAKDFYDIFEIITRYRIDLTTADNIELTKNIFSAKKVPLQLIGEIEKTKEFHESGYPSLVDTINSVNKIESFEFYFDFVVEQAQKLKPLWYK